MNSNNSLYILIIFICSLGIQLNAFADDVTATTTSTIGSTNSGSVTLNITGGTAPYTYSWTGPGGYTNNTKDIAGVDSGEYCVSITDAYCGTTTICARVGYSSQNTGIIKSSNLIGAIYPNPFSADVNIIFNKEINTLLDIQVYDVLGKEVYSSRLVPTNNAILLHIPEHLKKGNYFIVAKNKEEIIYKSTLTKN